MSTIIELQASTASSKEALGQLTETVDLPAIRAAAGLGVFASSNVRKKNNSDEIVMTFARALGVEQQVKQVLTNEWRLQVFYSDRFPLAEEPAQRYWLKNGAFGRDVREYFCSIKNQIFLTKGKMADASFEAALNLDVFINVLEGGSYIVDEQGNGVKLLDDRTYFETLREISKDIFQNLIDLSYSKKFMAKVEKSFDQLINENNRGITFLYCNLIFMSLYHFREGKRFEKIEQFLEQENPCQKDFLERFHNFFFLGIYWSWLWPWGVSEEWRKYAVEYESEHMGY
jgi:hypothetical protein